MLVCTHGNVDAACARFGYPIYKLLRDSYAAQPGSNLRAWRCSHFGGHKFAPTLVDLPEGRYWGHLEPEVVDILVRRQGEISRLRSHYRGWSGLGKFEQIAERDIWLREGWDWLTYAKSGQTLRKGLQGTKSVLFGMLRWLPSKHIRAFLETYTSSATWAEVEIEFVDSERVTRTYRGRVELCGRVQTLGKTVAPGREIKLQSVPQFRTTWIEK